MSSGLPDKARLLKRLTTKSSPERIELALAVLGATPERLRNLRAGLSETELNAPLGEGERSFKRDLNHLIYCAERGEYRIVHALLLDLPNLPRIHAERDWGKLMRYEAFPITELLAYFLFRRRALLGILCGLQPEQWERSVHREGVKRSESVYYAARNLCMHEVEHLEDLAKKLSTPPRSPPLKWGRLTPSESRRGLCESPILPVRGFAGDLQSRPYIDSA